MQPRSARATRGATALGLVVGIALVSLVTGSPAAADASCQSKVVAPRTGGSAAHPRTSAEDVPVTVPSTAVPTAAPTEMPTDVPTDVPTDWPTDWPTDEERVEVQQDASEPDPSADTTEPAEPAEETTEPADLSIEASTSPQVVEQDEVVTLTITIYNAGPGDEPAVTVSDSIPGGAVLAEPVPGLDASTGLLDLGSLAAGESMTITIPLLLPERTGSVETSPVVHGVTSDAYPIDDQTCTVVTVSPTPDPPSQPPPPPSTAGGNQNPTDPSDTDGTGGGNGQPAAGDAETGSAPVAGMAAGPGPTADPQHPAGIDPPSALPGAGGPPDHGDPSETDSPSTAPGSGGPDGGGSPSGSGAVGGGAGTDSRIITEPAGTGSALGVTAALHLAGWLFLLAGVTFVAMGGLRHSRLWH